MTLQDYLHAKGTLIEYRLDELVPEKYAPHKELYNAARYSLLNGGKRLRPILTIATAEMLGSDVNIALTPACALEMIHTYSLIHDDLPCMDDDDFRRGKPSLHKAFTEAHAVLAGDFLLTYAFQVLSEAPGLTPQQRLSLIQILSKQSGGDGMIAGQVLDIESEGKTLTIEQLQQIHKCKTGALILAAVEFGAVIAGASVGQMEALQQFGREIGLAFQIVDDVLDITSSQAKHGKAVASDLINGKATYVTLLGLEGAQEASEHHYSLAMHALNRIEADTSRLASIASLIVHRHS